jgi:hypothetical protein
MKGKSREEIRREIKENKGRKRGNDLDNFHAQRYKEFRKLIKKEWFDPIFLDYLKDYFNNFEDFAKSFRNSTDHRILKYALHDSKDGEKVYCANSTKGDFPLTSFYNGLDELNFILIEPEKRKLFLYQVDEDDDEMRIGVTINGLAKELAERQDPFVNAKYSNYCEYGTPYSNNWTPVTSLSEISESKERAIFRIEDFYKKTTHL